MVIASVITQTLFGRRFGFCNKFDHARAKHIREACGCAAEGNVTLFCLNTPHEGTLSYAGHFAAFDGNS